MIYNGKRDFKIVLHFPHSVKFEIQKFTATINFELLLQVENERLKNGIPFAVVGANTTLQVLYKKNFKNIFKS